MFHIEVISYDICLSLSDLLEKLIQKKKKRKKRKKERLHQRFPVLLHYINLKIKMAWCRCRDRYINEKEKKILTPASLHIRFSILCRSYV